MFMHDRIGPDWKMKTSSMEAQVEEQNHTTESLTTLDLHFHVLE